MLIYRTLLACLIPVVFLIHRIRRAFWLQSWPLLLITTFITIISFTEYGSITFGSVDDDEYFEARQRLALSLGILGLLSTFLTVLIINTRYQSQHDMHAMAERSLGKIC